MSATLHRTPVDAAAPAAVHAPGRQRRKEARPQELLDAALDLFVEKGFAATRSEEVATRAGVLCFISHTNVEKATREPINAR